MRLTSLGLAIWLAGILGAQPALPPAPWRGAGVMLTRQVVDLRNATVLPGLIDAHTHMFNVRGKGATEASSLLIAVQNAQAYLRAGFTSARDMGSHGNGYLDVAIRDGINGGRFDGPRYQVSTRGIVWGGDPRAAVREQVMHGADWIKLFPAV